MKTTVQQFLTVIVIILLALNLFVNGRSSEDGVAATTIEKFYGQHVPDQIEDFIMRNPGSVKAIAISGTDQSGMGIIVLQ